MIIWIDCKIKLYFSSI